LESGHCAGSFCTRAGLLPVDHPAVPRALFDLLIGINRWLYRVLIYVALMRNEYPPFRLDQSGMSPTTWNLIARPRHNTGPYAGLRCFPR
jgi:hypothetical protein